MRNNFPQQWKKRCLKNGQARLVQRDVTSDDPQKRILTFPFFGQISKTVDHLIFLIKPDVNENLGIMFDEEQRRMSSPFEVVDKESLRTAMVDAAINQLAKFENVSFKFA